MSPDRISQFTSAMAAALEPLAPSNREMLGAFATLVAALVLNAPNEGYDGPPLAMLDKTLNRGAGQRAAPPAGAALTVADTADSVAELFERDDLDNGEVLMVIAFLLLNMLEEGIPPLEALDEYLTDIRNCVTDHFAQPCMPAEVRH